VDYAAAVEFFFAPGPEGAQPPDVAPTPARRLRDALEPMAMHAVWSEPVNEALAGLGLDDFFVGYVTGRGAPLGEVPGALVAAAFGVFEPGAIGACWATGRAAVKLPELIAERDRATATSLRATIESCASETDALRTAEVLERAVAAVHDTGRPLFAALRAQPQLTDPYGRLWRAADLVREHRGDGHIAACVAAGLDPVRMGILAETWVGYPVGEYSSTRAWPQEAHDAAVARLEADGLIEDGEITERGRQFRDAIEAATDAAQADLITAVGDELDGVVTTVDTWSAACVDAHAFPVDPRKRAAG